ncbi:hypothetical protein PANT_9c00096 [Moesziomyces antarcticus T-34]|uniref:Uncharacterized protein n=1 Tax=Pseudozyma antarctica (strain T-34) TaxID=1151754 RepID=M9LNI3_PSEA3|nr:hypothetical protein PANT_9c00096 [Moesziomyces antarcticus T-34]
MSELFDSLNLSNSGPSSSQLSSSQPSTSKVFWHASPSPGVLRQLNNWTPSRSQDSPTLPLCTQAFVGELQKLPGALEAQSPLVSRDAAKRKLGGSSRKQGRNVSDPTTIKEKTRGFAVLEISDDDEDDAVGGAEKPARLLLGDVGESSPESRRRRTMDAGNTGRVRQPSSPSDLSCPSKSTMQPVPAVQPSSQPTGSHRRLDRRHPRRRKRESLMAGLGFSDESGTDCLKLFEDLQAAIRGIQAPRTASNDHADPALNSAGQSNSAGSGADQPESVRLTPREGLNRTTSAPTSARPNLSSRPHSAPHEDQGEGSQSRRVFRPVKSDHDVFNAVRQEDERQARILQPRAVNVAAQPEPQSKPAHSALRSPSPSEPVRRQSQSHPSVGTETRLETALPSRAPPPPVEAPAAARHDQSTAVTMRKAHEGADETTARAAASPVKRSARIEAMQQTSTGKKLGVRAPSAFTKAASASPRKAAGGTVAPVASASASQYVASASQAGATAATAASGPAAPFRPPAISRVTPTRLPPKPAQLSSRRSAQQGRVEHAASSDDSFADDDDAFLALACELEY